jgi:tRNA modification GTPase
LSAASSLWAYLDYPEEDLQTMEDEEMILHLQGIVSSCRKLLDSFETGRAIQSGIPAVIVGKPNVGKSTFFNLFLGEEKAIVTSVPGTTRDVIEYPVTAGRVLLHLADTAGMRSDAADQVEEIGIERALSVAKDSKLIFALFDRSRPLDEEDEMVLDLLRNCREEKKIIPILTKCDLEEKLPRESIDFLGTPLCLSNDEDFDFSALRDFVERMFISDESALEEGQIITNMRQKTNLEKTVLLLTEAMDHITCGAKDIASLTLESALSALLEIDGKSAGEKILDQVFSRFCIGK